ncbi:MAG: hypothetical protein LCH96_10820 [Actinobacteria bacterium]|nr:hypothetical protein [Actinomycetota bacterium]
MERLLLGDNQFFGVNHMSEEKARQQQMQFQDDEAIIAVLEAAYAEGIHSFMCTTHDRMGAIADHFRAHRDEFPEFTVLPGMPYAHKYANAVTTDGMVGAIQKFLPDGGLLDAAVRGTRSMARKEIEGVLTLLVDAEMKMFAGLPTPVVWLQNVVTDLLLGMGFNGAFEVFARHVREKYDAEPGFITMNLPLAVERLNAVGIENPLICSNINKIGFRMSGGIDAYRRLLDENRFRAVAMSVYASGAIPPEEAIEWVCAQPHIEAIVFGASSARNIASTRQLVDRYWPTQAAGADSSGRQTP